MSGLFFYLCVVIRPPTASNMPKEQLNMQADEKAFRELIGRQRDLIWALCRTYRLGAAWDTEDAFHEVLVALWQGFGSYGGRSSERTWVYRVAVNTLNSLLRRRGNQPAPEMPEGYDSVAAGDDYPDLAHLIEALPEPDYTIVRAHVEGYSYAEIGRICGLSVGAVSMRLVRVLRKLRKQYNQ